MGMIKNEKNKKIRWGMLLIFIALLFITLTGCTEQKQEERVYYSSFSQLQDKRIGVNAGSVQAALAMETFPDAQFYYFDTNVDMLAALRAGKIDAYADAEALVRYMMPENPDLTFLNERLSQVMQVCAVFPKTEKGKALCDTYTAFIRTIKENGIYQEVMDTWFGPDNGEKAITDLNDLEGEKGTLHVAVDSTMLPFTFIKDGKLAGSDIDILVRFCKEYGYGLQIEQMDFAGIIPAVSTSSCDMACGGIAYTEERAESLYFAEPSFEGSSVVAVLKAPEDVSEMTLEDLKKPGTKIAVLTGSELYNAAQEHFPEGEYLQYDTFADVFNAVNTGKADAALGFDTNIPLLPDSYPELTHIDEKLTQYWYGFGTQKNQEGKKLQEEMNAWFAQYVENGSFDKLIDKWNSSNGEQVMDTYTFDGRNGILKIATLGTWSPMSFYSGSELTGVFVELMNGFCEAYGYQPVYSAMPYVSEIAGLNAGEYDVIADNIVRTPDRMENINITDPLFTNDVYAIVKSSKASGEPATGSFFTTIKDSFIKNIIREDRWKMLLSGLGVTLALSALSGLLGTMLGGIVCFLRMRKNKVLSGFAGIYIRIFRGIPIVVLLLVLNYLIFTGASFPAFWVCVIGFALDFSAYTSEMFRNGIEAVPRGQSLAATALGFGNIHGFRKVILPQALLHILPVYTGQFIALVKLTSVAGYISVMDLTRASDIIRSRTYEAFFPLILTAVIYFLLSVILIALLRKLEKKIQPGSRRIKKLMELMEVRNAGRLQTVRSAFSGAGEEIKTGQSLYRVEHLLKKYENATPIHDINCEIKKGDVIAVIGPSGTGKSTFLHLLNQLERQTGGDIYFKEENILARGYDLKALRKKVGMVFQAFFLFSHLTIVENVMLAQEELLHRTKEEAFGYSMEVLERVGLSDKALNYPDELSGGQQQRVAIAREVAMDPEMILFDEPTSALDPTTIGEVLSVIRNLARNNMTMVIVTHEMNFARDVSNRVFYLDEGVIYEEGTPQQIFSAPRKEKTRQFINHLRVLNLPLTGEAFDYAGAVTQMENFGHRNMIDYSLVRRMNIVFEELGLSILREHFCEKTQAQFTFEYQEASETIHMRAVFHGSDYDPLLEGDAVSVALVKNAMPDISCHLTDQEGIIEGTIVP